MDFDYALLERYKDGCTADENTSWLCKAGYVQPAFTDAGTIYRLTSNGSAILQYNVDRKALEDDRYRLEDKRYKAQARDSRFTLILSAIAALAAISGCIIAYCAAIGCIAPS